MAPTSKRTWLAGTVWAIALTAPAALRSAWAEPPDAAAVEFFEREIRPVLAENCWKCHGAKKQEGGLRLDSRERVLAGGDSGPVVVAGKPDESQLIAAVRQSDELKMPPKGKLSDSAVAALSTWIKLGLPWPADPTAGKASGPPSPAEARRSHWAFQAVREPPLPDAGQTGWVQSPIDQFILARLDAAGISPSEPADRRTLIRRLSYDLIGLPPSADEADQYVDDSSPDATERLVERLLASPAYGERWGRHWLDVARYADTKGYVYAGEERRYAFSHVYRDWVTRALNDDLPYDRFLLAQLAADQSTGPGATPQLAAMGFLTLGRRFVNNVHDVIDDRLDVIFRGTQGLSVSCARCHDHKFDPIPTRDYYSLYGVLAASTEQYVRLTDAPPSGAEAEKFQTELAARESARAKAMDEKRHELSERLRGKSTEYLLAVLDAVKQPSDDFYVILGPDDLNPVIVRRWQSYLLAKERGFDRVFGPWHALVKQPQPDFAARAAELAARLAGSEEAAAVNPLVAKLLIDSPPASMRDLAERYGKLLTSVYAEWRGAVEAARKAGATAPAALSDPAREELRQVLYAADAPTSVPPVRIGEIETFFDEKTRVALNEAQAKVDQWNLQSPLAPPQALVIEDSPLVRNPRVFVRGNPKVKGDEVPRQFLAVLAGKARQPFANGSGRLELARCIASRDNPLTARVMVNRVWMHHFGEGLVRTPSDFGFRGEPPTHPELVDYLAARFMADGWSLKKLHRLIVLSAAYQQSSAIRPEAAARDPENRLLWRANRRRLEFEALRDALLVAAGLLDRTIGGRGAALWEAPFSTRRSLYGLVDRQNLPGVMRAFDFANPDQHTPYRHRTTVPQQSLFLMNHPFVIEQVRAAAARAIAQAGDDTAERTRAAYRVVLARAPSAAQREIGMAYLAEQSPTDDEGAAAEQPLSRFESLVHALVLSNEFALVD